MDMNSGIIQGHMLTHCRSRREFFDYLKSLNITPAELKKHGKYFVDWLDMRSQDKGKTIRNTIKKQMEFKK